jgi:hypothetical protein
MIKFGVLRVDADEISLIRLHFVEVRQGGARDFDIGKRSPSGCVNAQDEPRVALVAPDVAVPNCAIPGILEKANYFPAMTLAGLL